MVGAGPAGLSAALILGRCRRRVLVCDAGHARNAASRALHGFLTRDGVAPSELRRLGRAQLERYPTVEVREVEVAGARLQGGAYRLTLAGGRAVQAPKLLLATGVVDQLPHLPGLADLYGRSVFHCPYCDGWEQREEPLAAYGRGRGGVGLALELTVWSRDVALVTDGRRLRRGDRAALERRGIQVRTEVVAGLEGQGGRLRRILFEQGEPLPRRALFFSSGQHQRSPLATVLGCSFDRRGSVKTNRLQLACRPGLYVAGDASRDVQLAVVAAAEGASAAFAINQALLKEELAREHARPAPPREKR